MSCLHIHLSSYVLWILWLNPGLNSKEKKRFCCCRNIRLSLNTPIRCEECVPGGPAPLLRSPGRKQWTRVSSKALLTSSLGACLALRRPLHLCTNRFSLPPDPRAEFLYWPRAKNSCPPVPSALPPAPPCLEKRPGLSHLSACIQKQPVPD